MKTVLTACLMILCACAATFAQPAIGGLKAGDPAPPLKNGKWVQGEPVTSFEPGKVYVVEFWATWCGPCVDAIPHLNDLQKKYADKGVVVIGQNVWEEDESLVEPFVRKMGDRMSYRVVMDDKSGGGKGEMATTWMMAAGQNGIPASFVIDQKGRIAWIGHPMALDKVLEQVVAGTWDIAKHAEETRKNEEFNRAFTAAMKEKDWETALRMARERGGTIVLHVLTQKGDFSQAVSYARELMETGSGNPPKKLSAMQMASFMSPHAARSPEIERFFRELVAQAKGNGEFAAATNDAKGRFLVMTGDAAAALPYMKAHLRSLADDREPAAAFAVSFFKNLQGRDDAGTAMTWAGMVVDEKLSDDWRVLNTFAWDIATGEKFKDRDLDLAMRCAVQAVESTGGNNPDCLDTLARIQFDRGDKAKAIETQRKALELAPDKRKAEFQKALDRYTAEAGG
jgi:thiol-disulfide isomerase/thioredoxin/tetratricopeptide (TPR) repeat protein